MKQVSIGIRISDEGLDFFGTEEVNELLAQGYVVTSIEPGNVMVEEIELDEDEEVGEDEEEAVSLAGADMTVTLEKRS